MRIRLNQRNAIPFEMLTHTLLIRMVQTDQIDGVKISF